MITNPEIVKNLTGEKLDRIDPTGEHTGCRNCYQYSSIGYSKVYVYYRNYRSTRVHGILKNNDGSYSRSANS